MWTTLNFRSSGKTKNLARDIYMWTLDIEFERDQSIGLGSTFGDIHTDRQTFFLKHHFRMWEWCRIEFHKKTEVKFFDHYNTSFTPIMLLKRRRRRRRRRRGKKKKELLRELKDAVTLYRSTEVNGAETPSGELFFFLLFAER